MLSVTEIHSERGESREGVKLLREVGLVPAFILSGKGERTFAFSRFFKGRKGRIVCIGYGKEDNGSFVARTFYLSNSHGVFKYLPRYRANEEGEAGWFDKGFGEQSVSLAYSLQRSLSRLCELEGSTIEIDKPMKVFAITAREMAQSSKSTYSNFVIEEPRVVLGLEGADESGFEKIPPESITIPDGKYPNFDNVLGSWMQENDLYGRIKLTSFFSQDGSLIYTFASDVRGRGWVANIEPKDVTTSMGIHPSHVVAKSLMTPAFEYSSEADGYGDPSIEKGDYIDMYTNYLSRVPVIKEFLEKIPLQDTQEFPTP